MSLFWILVLGLIVYRLFSRRNKKEQKNLENEEVKYLQTIVQELTIEVEKSPKKTVEQLLAQYKDRLKKLGLEKTHLPVLSQSVSTSALQTDLGSLWSHWYSNNSINLLLYIGAFLIVASASVFVGFQWGTLSGTIKAAVLTFVTTAFFGFGIWFFNIPKIRNAGSTFIGIGALLIPVCGTAWYNFVFKDLGVHAGPVWFITSFIALGVYMFLTYQYKNKFYTYISSITSLSLTFSLVNTFNLDSNFYILASIFTSFILLLSSFLFRNQDKEIENYAQIPLEVSAQVMMPVSLLYGLFIATGQHRLNTPEAVASIFLASGFYLLSYLYSKKSWNIALSEILFSFGLVLFFHWQKIDNNLLLYALSICAVVYLYLAYFMRNLKLVQEQDISIALGLIQLIFTFTLSFIWSVNPLHHTLISLTLVFAGVGVAYIKREIRFLGLSSIFIAITTYLFYVDILKFTHKMEFLGVVYFVIGLIFYTGLIYLKNKYEIKEVFGLSAGMFFFLSLIFTFNTTLYLLILSLLISAVSAHAGWEFEKPPLFYVSNAFLTFSLFNFLRYYKVDNTMRPFFYAVLSYVFYSISIFIDKRFQEFYRGSALVVSVITPLFFGLESFSYSKSILERNAIMTGYSATALFGFDVYLRKAPNFGYITSALGMFSYLWQIKYNGITENLAYTLPLGVYFLILAYTRKIKDDENGRNTLDLVGLFFLLTPSLFLSFGNEAMKYSVTLGFVGIILLGLGITLSYKFYRYGGVAGIVLAVLPQTYNYILALPRWVAIGIVGIIFLSVAMYLLLKRKE